MRNLRCLLPDGYIVVGYYTQHPCDDRAYLIEALCWGPNGSVGRWIPDRLASDEAEQ